MSTPKKKPGGKQQAKAQTPQIIHFFPNYPFKAGALRCVVLPGGKVDTRVGAYHFTREDFDFVKSIVPEAFSDDELNYKLLKEFLIQKCGISRQDLQGLSWSDIFDELKLYTEKPKLKPPEGEWSNPMTKTKMMKTLHIAGYSKFATFAKQYGLRQAGNRQLWQIRLDDIDKNTRQKFEKA
jgi:hypothetical protein